LRHPFPTQRDAGSTVVAELSAVGVTGAGEIGRGGFGIVFRCHQAALDRTVAVMVLTAELARIVNDLRASSAQWAGSPDTRISPVLAFVGAAEANEA